MDRPLRADARRNRDRILAAADTVFSAGGAGAPIDDVAELAGTGVGTVYRHFPTKDALIEAVLVEHLQNMTQVLGELQRSEDPGEAFVSGVMHAGSFASQKRELAESLASAGIDIKDRAGDSFSALHDGFAALLARAQDAGAIRADVGIDEIMSLISGSCLAAGEQSNRSPVCVERLLRVVCDGLRAPAPTPTDR